MLLLLLLQVFVDEFGLGGVESLGIAHFGGVAGRKVLRRSD